MLLEIGVLYLLPLAHTKELSKSFMKTDMTQFACVFKALKILNLSRLSFIRICQEPTGVFTEEVMVFYF